MTVDDLVVQTVTILRTVVGVTAVPGLNVNRSVHALGEGSDFPVQGKPFVNRNAVVQGDLLERRAIIECVARQVQRQSVEGQVIQIGAASKARRSDIRSAQIRILQIVALGKGILFDHKRRIAWVNVKRVYTTTIECALSDKPKGCGEIYVIDITAIRKSVSLNFSDGIALNIFGNRHGTAVQLTDTLDSYPRVVDNRVKIFVFR